MTNVDLWVKFLSPDSGPEGHTRHLKYMHGVMRDTTEIARWVSPTLCIVNDSPQTKQGKVHLRQLKEAVKLLPMGVLNKIEVVPIAHGYRDTFVDEDRALEEITVESLRLLINALAFPSSYQHKKAQADVIRCVNSLVLLEPHLYTRFPLLSDMRPVIDAVFKVFAATPEARKIRRKGLNTVTCEVATIMAQVDLQPEVYFATGARSLTPEEFETIVSHVKDGAKTKDGVKALLEQWQRLVRSIPQLHEKNDVAYYNGVALRVRVCAELLAQRGVKPFIVPNSATVEMHFADGSVTRYPASLFRMVRHRTNNFTSISDSFTVRACGMPGVRSTLHVSPSGGCTFDSRPDASCSLKTIQLVNEYLEAKKYA